jgi:hypothetical protein
MSDPTMKPLLTIEESNGLFSVLLPPCDALVLDKVLDHATLYVWMLDCATPEICSWYQSQTHPFFFPLELPESIFIRSLEMDVCVTTTHFLNFLTNLSLRGIDIIQAKLPMPRNLSLKRIRPEARAHLFQQLGILLQFYLPHPREYASVTSPSREVLDRIISLFT